MAYNGIAQLETSQATHPDLVEARNVAYIISHEVAVAQEQEHTLFIETFSACLRYPRID